ncbi:MAG TPA: trans-aconitate 2-methyltransferase [Alphaproteobacteria bacterium]|nr:trans-aconitate 2-methyltransferase [Alphaproteobacteria bacterium]
MSDWDAAQYRKFEDERTRPALDLLTHVPVDDPSTVFDLGCGPGNSTELLLYRFPNAHIVGVDSSPAMIDAARERLPEVTFETEDIAGWGPSEPADLLYSNATLQWLPDHGALFPRLASYLAPNGILAVQMPDNLDEPCHVLMRQVARDGVWADKLGPAVTERSGARAVIGRFEDYYQMLRPVCRRIDLWLTTYVPKVDGIAGIVEWLKGTGLRPFLDPLSESEREDFLAAYKAALGEAYPVQPDGKVLLDYPRIFIVAQR